MSIDTGSPTTLELHILRSYSALRWTMAGLGFLLPPFLTIGGSFQFWWLEKSLPLQASLSAYYHAGGGCSTSYGVYRNLFVGILCVIAACLAMYSGFSTREDRLLNFAGASLLLVALFPTSWSAADIGEKCTDKFIPFVASSIFGTGLSIHLVAAIAFFIFITAANVTTAFDSIRVIREDSRKKVWHRIFSVFRWLMPFSILASYLLAQTFDSSRTILWVEWGGIYAFSLYWLLKSIEILRTKVDYDMISGQMRFSNNLSNRIERVEL